MSDSQKILNSIEKLDEWIERNDRKAYDPFDGLSSPVASPLTFNNHYLRIALQQGVRRFPINLRPILGIRKQTSSKGLAFCARAYLSLYQATGEESHLDKMNSCLDWLIRNPSPGFTGYSWGNHFSYESRGGTIPRGVPTIVWTSLVSRAFLDAYEALGNEEYLQVPRKACDFILTEIGRHVDADDSLCFMYTPVNKGNPSFEGCVHNANVLGSSVLGRVYRHTKEKDLFDVAQKSINYAMKYQLPHGGWYYGEHPKFQWEDSFHTAYNLESIHAYVVATGDEKPRKRLIEGYRFWKKTFFGADGTPRYYDFKTYPIDIQCASQGIETLANLAEYDEGSVDLSLRVALWTIKNLQDSDGHFYFRKYPLMTNKTPMFHWGQATMLAGLARLYKAIC